MLDYLLNTIMPLVEQPEEPQTIYSKAHKKNLQRLPQLLETQSSRLRNLTELISISLLISKRSMAAKLPKKNSQKPEIFLIKNLDLFTTQSMSSNSRPSWAQEELSLKQFLTQLVLLGDFDEHILLHSFILIERFLIDSKLTGYIDFRRVLTVAFFLVQKYFTEEEHWFVEDMATLGNMKEQVILDGEIAFLEVLEFKVHVKEDEKQFYREFLQVDELETNGRE